MSAKTYNTEEPILILVRRGRKGRGFSIAPVEDASNAALCADENEVGEVIKEMLDDPEQPRVNMSDLLAPAPTSRQETAEEADDEDEYEDEEDESRDPHEGTLLEGTCGSADPVDAILFNVFQRVVQKGQSMSSKRIRSDVRPRRKKKKRT